jgi:beta-glucosidase
VLLKNERATLPIRGSRPVYVAGSNADNIGNQAGGWTLTWQGGSINVIPGQTILQGIRSQHDNVTWCSQEPINIGDRQYDPLFPYGFGLRTG